MNLNNASTFNQTQKSPSVVPGYAWVILFVTLFASVSAPLNQFKVPPLLPVLIEELGLDLGTSGMLMSIFAITGCILALPAGMILQKIGPKATGLIALGSLVSGAILGAVSNSAGLLFFSRFIEGAGMGLIAVVAPAIIANWFPPDKRSGPMGIWATWVPIGNILMFVSAPALGTALGWKAVWWAGAAFGLVALVLFWIFIRSPQANSATSPSLAGTQSQPEGQPVSFGKALANRDIWLISLAFACFNMVLVGAIGTYYPTFLSTERGFSLSTASTVSALGNVVGIIVAPLAGLLIDRVGKRKPFVLAAILAVMVWVVFPFSVAAPVIPILMALMGVIASVIPTATFSAIPDLMSSPMLAGIGMAVLSLGQNLGQLVGSLVFGNLVEATGWVNAGLWLLPVLLVGLAATWLTRMR